ncbi:TMV resistance protein N [Prunus yedoensis var. nudiflora]|uniref:TMV resistance protein N n=1 Tax=Prunus yedoensis var. nudiflora TaxID=2094558 RepID=A0A314V234_PRUYE|nr:TMV resistance protein N [Prunus yedoensis var. nudiflora]
MPTFEIVTPGSRIPEWFNNQSVGDSLIVELPPCTTSICIAFCAVFEDGAPVDHPNPRHYLSTYFQIECRPGEVDKECSQMKISFQTLSYKGCPSGAKTYCSGIKKCGFRLVHKQDMEELNQIMMMNHSINISTKAPRNSADASARWNKPTRIFNQKLSIEN